MDNASVQPHSPAAELLLQRATRDAVPAVLRGLNAAWPALHRWAGLQGLEYLQQTAGDAEVQVCVFVCVAHCAWQGWCIVCVPSTHRARWHLVHPARAPTLHRHALTVSTLPFALNTPLALSLCCNSTCCRYGHTLQAMLSQSSEFFGDIEHHTEVSCSMGQILAQAAQQHHNQQQQPQGEKQESRQEWQQQQPRHPSHQPGVAVPSPVLQDSRHAYAESGAGAPLAAAAAATPADAAAGAGSTGSAGSQYRAGVHLYLAQQPLTTPGRRVLFRGEWRRGG